MSIKEKKEETETKLVISDDNYDRIKHNDNFDL